MKIAVLAVQGAFVEHIDKLRSMGVECVELRQLADLEQHFDGMILPGGESTVQGKLLRELGMFEPLREKIRMGLPVMGTCAGLILLAEKLSNDSNVYFGTLPVCVQRNAYGRQLGSFHTEQEFAGIGRVPMTFIRAPYIESLLEEENAIQRDAEKNGGQTVEKTSEDDTQIVRGASQGDGIVPPMPEVLARVEDRIVAVRCGKQIGIAFHPELDGDNRIHEMFLEMCGA